MSDIKEIETVGVLNELDELDDEDDAEVKIESIDTEEDPDDPIEHDSEYENESEDPIEHEVEEKENLNDSNYFRNIQVTPRDKRVTSNVMTMAEYAEVIGTRMTQIENGAPPYIEKRDFASIEELAKYELFNRRCPLKIQRMITPNIQEQWSCREMAFPPHVRSGY